MPSHVSHLNTRFLIGHVARGLRLITLTILCSGTLATLGFTEERSPSSSDSAMQKQRREVIQSIADSANRLGQKVQNGQFGVQVLDEQKRVLEMIRQLLPSDDQNESSADSPGSASDSSNTDGTEQSSGEHAGDGAGGRPENADNASNASSDPSQGSNSKEPTDGATGDGAGQGPDESPAPANWSAWQRATLEDAVWGHLPPQERRQLSRTYSETFLPGYEDQVKAYFERLARLGTRAADSRGKSEEPAPHEE
ncbi:hypothetical protein AB1L42_16790 [Thalassoglobus sp. JC818]|uniref:hypothetical protein n=1 Tax=Thalassoglobus sp. JC818 TaxID=3232136 RepID=UPI003458E458